MDRYELGALVKVELSDAPMFAATVVAVDTMNVWYRVLPVAYGPALWVSHRRIVGLAA